MTFRKGVSMILGLGYLEGEREKYLQEVQGRENGKKEACQSSSIFGG